MPNYCPGLVEEGSTTAIDPVPRNWGIDYEVEWNASITMEDANISEDYVRTPTSTTDLLCSPRTYIDYDYKNRNINVVYGRTFSGYSELPLDMIGILNNGVVQMQSLTEDGSDPWNPLDGNDDTDLIDACGTELREFYTYG